MYKYARSKPSGQGTGSTTNAKDKIYDDNNNIIDRTSRSSNDTSSDGDCVTGNGNSGSIGNGTRSSSDRNGIDSTSNTNTTKSSSDSIALILMK